MPAGSLVAQLTALAEAGVEFIVVGGVAAVAGGAPVNTFDVDIVPARNPKNIERLLTVLDSLDAIYRFQPERRLRPTTAHLTGPGHHNLETRHGWLDVLGTIGRGRSYEDLLPHSAEMEIGGGVRVRVLDLETIIVTKEEVGGEKDRAMLPLLRRTLLEKRKSRR